MSKQTDFGPGPGVKAPVMADVQRQPYDWSNWRFKTGAIGSLQTLVARPVNAGDSVSLDLSAVVRLSPLRQFMYLDAVVDLFAFYIPHRHIYASNSAGSRWEDWIKAGIDESVTLGTDTPASGTILQNLGYLPTANIALPRWLTRGYVQIWNRYFRDPSDTAGILADDYLTTVGSTSNIAKYGLPCAHLKRIWNSAVPSTLTSADYSLPLSGGEVNLYELAALKGRLKTETRRDFFSTRYQDILHETYGSTVNIDADQRPELIMRSRNWLSGQDINGTDDATLGRFTGKSIGMSKIGFPSKFFPEHGTLWVMALLRYPPIYSTEVNYSVTHPEPTYLNFAGDPDAIRRAQPISLLASDVFHGNAATDLGKTPYGQWHREEPSCIHNDFIAASGHPFVDPGSISTRGQVVYIDPDIYDSVFSTLALKHWQIQAFVDMQVKSYVPDATVSIYAGTE